MDSQDPGGGQQQDEVTKADARRNAKQAEEAENGNQLLLYCVYAASERGDLVRICALPTDRN